MYIFYKSFHCRTTEIHACHILHMPMVEVSKKLSDDQCHQTDNIYNKFNVLIKQYTRGLKHFSTEIRMVTRLRFA